MSSLIKFKQSDVEIIDKKRTFNGFFKIDEYHFRHALFSGGQSDVIVREIFERGDAVAVLPYDPKLNAVLLIEQIRIGALSETKSPWLLEVIAGMTDGSLDYEAVVRKEAQEESGIQLNHVELMLSYLSSPGGTSERIYLYYAETDLSEVGGVYGAPDEGEDIKVHIVPIEQAFALVDNGEIDNAATIICLQWLKLNQDKLKE
jgi:ADP-ribose pyrophosphatase